MAIRTGSLGRSTGTYVSQARKSARRMGSMNSRSSGDSSTADGVALRSRSLAMNSGSDAACTGGGFGGGAGGGGAGEHQPPAEGGRRAPPTGESPPRNRENNLRPETTVR